jgi:hypothetical protein
MIKPDSLDALNDEELRGVIVHSQELLKKRDGERKAKALNDARALLQSVGLSLKDISGKPKKKAGKGPLYKGGRVYQHPTDKTLVWKANGQKPNWLRELEAQGGKAVEIEAANDNAPGAIKKTGG